MEKLFVELLSQFPLGDLLKLGIIIMFAINIWYLRRTDNRVRLAEYKHIATIHALQHTFKNGFMECYEEKMTELMKEHKFKVDGK